MKKMIENLRMTERQRIYSLSLLDSTPGVKAPLTTRIRLGLRLYTKGQASGLITTLLAVREEGLG